MKQKNLSTLKEKEFNVKTVVVHFVKIVIKNMRPQKVVLNIKENQKKEEGNKKKKE